MTRSSIFAQLSVEVIVALALVERVFGHSHTVGLFVGEIGMNQHAHGRGEVVDAIKFSLVKGTIIPKAGKNLFDGFGEMTFVRMMGE